MLIPKSSVTDVDYILANYTGGEPWTNLGNYANYFKQNFLPLCPNGDYDNTECFGTQNGKCDFVKRARDAGWRWRWWMKVMRLIVNRDILGGSDEWS